VFLRVIKLAFVYACIAIAGMSALILVPGIVAVLITKPVALGNYIVEILPLFAFGVIVATGCAIVLTMARPNLFAHPRYLPRLLSQIRQFAKDLCTWRILVLVVIGATIYCGILYWLRSK
jgi:branched-subunit amino acid transport protein